MFLHPVFEEEKTVNNIKGVIFDFDGTLADSMKYWELVASRYLKSKNKEIDLETNDFLKGMPVFKSSVYIKEKYNIKDSIEKISADIYKTMEIPYKYEIELKEGVREYLDFLKEKGIKMCIATATDLFMIDFIMKRLDLYKYFEFLISSKQLNSSKADSPLIYEESLKRLGTSKSETIIFEDATYAIKTAKAADFYVVGVYDNMFKDDEEFIRKKADRYIYSFKELLN